jgi:hypothetical protein
MSQPLFLLLFFSVGAWQSQYFWLEKQIAISAQHVVTAALLAVWLEAAEDEACIIFVLLSP